MTNGCVPDPSQVRTNWHERVVLVTGGTRGMGAAMVREFARLGAKTIVVSRRPEACAAAAAEIVATFGTESIGLACNVSIWAEVDDLVRTVDDLVGPIDVLVNNAGGAPVYSDVADVSEALFDKTIALNLRGPFRLCSLFGTRMKQRGSGSIINVSSNAASRPLTFSIPYSAAKLALHNMTEAFAQLLGPEVRVNCIQPGMFMTDVSKAWDLDEVLAKAESYALGRPAQPDEIVGAVVFLAGDDAKYITGAVLRVDGGIP